MCPLMSRVSAAATDVSPCSAASGRAPRLANTTTRHGQEIARPVFLENIGAFSPLKKPLLACPRPRGRCPATKSSLEFTEATTAFDLHARCIRDLFGSSRFVFREASIIYLFLTPPAALISLRGKVGDF